MLGTTMSENIANFIINELEKSGPIPSDDPLAFNFIDSGHIDSLSIMKFLVLLEGEFNLQFSDDELLSEEFKTVSGLSNLISNKLAE